MNAASDIGIEVKNQKLVFPERSVHLLKLTKRTHLIELMHRTRRILQKCALVKQRGSQIFNFDNAEQIEGSLLPEIALASLQGT
ncbi:MAG: hypothetical protein R3F46_14600 [bacterium]